MRAIISPDPGELRRSRNATEKQAVARHWSEPEWLDAGTSQWHDRGE
jgi:hypothetical protein